jgi:D-xylose 1-dehydrogenase (NADP+, D-xylono-1,5-lactone-forming)
VNPLRWGVIGATSFVARRAVLPALSTSDTAELVAVASRSHGGAHLLRADFGAGRSYDDYDALLADPAVEAVYIPLPNAMHHEWTLRCAAAGKHVLCEKPLAVSAAQAQEMAAACTEAGVLLMEAYMTPFHPRAVEAVRIARQELGTLRGAHAVFTFPLRDPRNHRWNPLMGGGALLDVGVYCLSPLLAVAGDDPVDMQASMRCIEGGVDATTSGALRFAGGLQATFECSFEAEEQQLLEIAGEQGTLRATRAFTGMRGDVELHLTHGDGRVEVRRTPGADPYLGMVEHFAAAARGVEPLRRGPEESVRLLRLMDHLRRVA